MFIRNQNIKKHEEGKTISVIDLPDGSYHRNYFMQLVSDAVAAKICVVMRSNKDGSCTAFIGYPHFSEIRSEFRNNSVNQYNCTKIHSVGQVKKLGEKLSKETAFLLFPDWSGIPYKE